MIRYLHISNGKKRRGQDLNYQKPKKNELLWIFLTEPGEKEIAKVTKDFGLDRKPFYKYQKENHSVRYSMAPFAFVLFDYFVENGKTASAHLLFIIKDNLLVLATSKSSPFYDELFDGICSHIEENKIRAPNIGRVLHAFLQQDIEGNYDVIEKNEDEIIAIEERVANYEGAKEINVKDIIRLKRKLFRMSRRFWASTKVIFLLKAGFTDLKIDPETSKLLVDVHDTFLHQIDIVTAQKEMLSDVMSIYSTSINNKLAMISNEMNSVTKKVSSLALILLLPTLITSVYGMNIPDLPFAHDQYAFDIIMGGTMLLTFGLYLMFRRMKWL